jgi:hypothetical protein
LAKELKRLAYGDHPQPGPQIAAPGILGDLGRSAGGRQQHSLAHCLADVLE